MIKGVIFLRYYWKFYESAVKLDDTVFEQTSLRR